MDTRMDKIGTAGLAVTIAVAIGMVVHLSGQPAQGTADFRFPVSAEVRDAQGVVMLRGTFGPVGGDSDTEVERRAALTSVEGGGTATGDAEVEYQVSNPHLQDVEFNVKGVPARARLTLVIDGTAAVSATANDKGEAEGEVIIAVAQRP